jgi:hypothetical protein
MVEGHIVYIVSLVFFNWDYRLQYILCDMT